MTYGTEMDKKFTYKPTNNVYWFRFVLQIGQSTQVKIVSFVEGSFQTFRKYQVDKTPIKVTLNVSGDSHKFDNSCKVLVLSNRDVTFPYSPLEPLLVEREKTPNEVITVDQIPAKIGNYVTLRVHVTFDQRGKKKI